MIQSMEKFVEIIGTSVALLYDNLNWNIKDPGLIIYGGRAVDILQLSVLNGIITDYDLEPISAISTQNSL